MPIRITDLKIDPSSLGETLLLADISPVFEFDKDGKKTDNLVCYRYHVVVPQLKMEKIGVKVENKTPLIDLEKDQIPIGTQVKFDDLEIGSYFMNGQINVSAKASNISFVGKNNVQPPKAVQQ